MFTGAVQSVQVLLQLVLFAFGLLSICQGATLRCALHLLGPIGMWRFTKLLLHVIVCYHGQSIEFFILNLWYFFDGNVQVFPTNTVATALTYIKMFFFLSSTLENYFFNFDISLSRVLF